MRLPIILACLLLAGCNVAPPPVDEGEAAAAVDAAADNAKAPPAEEHTQLRDAIQAPIDRAKSVEDVNAEADAERRKAIEDAGG